MTQRAFDNPIPFTIEDFRVCANCGLLALRGAPIGGSANPCVVRGTVGQHFFTPLNRLHEASREWYSERLPEAEALAFLRAIEVGEITIEPAEDPGKIYCSDVTYKASNGWTLVVFNDCNTFDYVDHIEDPGGRTCDFGDYVSVDCYGPDARIVRDVYRIPE